MSEITIFKNPEFCDVRMVEMDGDPWFLGSDVATALGFKNVYDAITRHVPTEDRKLLSFKGSRESREADLWNGNDKADKVLISEAGMYAMIFGSKLESAQKFKAWVTREVIPSIRKTGKYSITEQVPKTFAEALKLAYDQQKTIEEQKLKIEMQQPKVEFADAILGCENSVSIDEVAKILTQNGVKNMGEKRLFQTLRELGFLGSRGQYYNMPNQQYVTRGYLEVEIKRGKSPAGNNHMYYVTRVTPKGLRYLISFFRKVDNDGNRA